jgi:nucleoside-diphosphate-sugar epimerase
VTGVSGFLGSHVADQLLAGGYLVTGTTRDAAKNAWVQRLFDGKYGEGKFRLIEVPDIAHQGAFDKLLDGKTVLMAICPPVGTDKKLPDVSGIVHAASDITMNPDPNQVITPMVAGTLNLLNAAAKQPAVKRFVLTSSCTSAASQKPGIGLTVDEKTWNDDVTREAWAPPPYAAERGFAVYSASKMEMERESWKWHEEHKPHFVLNTGQTRLVSFSVLLLTKSDQFSPA